MDSGSEFTGSIDVSGSVSVISGSYFIGDGRFLSNITLANLAIDSTKIFSGSITASVAPDYGFRVNAGAQISGSTVISASIREIPKETLNTVFDVVNDGADAYWFSGAVSGSNPTLTLVRGLEYTFNIEAAGHPFWFQTVDGAYDSNNVWLDGVQNAGANVGTIIFELTGSSIPNTLYYVCQNHSSMGGSINVVDGIYIPSYIDLIGDTTVTGSLKVTGSFEGFEVSASFFSGSGRDLFDIPISNISGDAFRIASGSVTASVAPDTGFVVLSFESGSYFYGDVQLVTGSFSGSGANLFNIPRSAISEDAFLIRTGSATASVENCETFIVTTAKTGSEIGSEFTGSVSVSGSIYFSEFIFGDGRFLTNVEAAAAPLIASGSATASVQSGDTFIITTSKTGSEFGSRFTGSIDVSGSVQAFSFIGDGSQLTNVQASAAPLIASGSATASVTSGDTFVVTAPISGSQFTGSLFVSGNIQLESGSFFSGSGAGLFDIPRTAFSGDAFRIASGSVTASTSPDYGFRVETTATGSQFGSQLTGSVDVSGSVKAFFFIGVGSQLTGVIAEAAQDVVAIQSGSVTASVSPEYVLRVESAKSGSEFTGSINVSGSISASLYIGDGGGLFNIPLDALEDLQLDKINSGSGVAIIDPTKLDVNVPITAARYDGDGSGLFNIPAEALEDLQLDRIISGSVQAVISPNRGLEIGTKTFVSGNLSVSGGLFVTGSNVVLASGSSFVGDGSGLTNINIANLAFETPILISGSATASISPDKGFVVNTSSFVYGDSYVEYNLRANSITGSHYIFSPLVSSSFLGTYNFQGVGPTASAQYSVLRFDEGRDYFVPQPEF